MAEQLTRNDVAYRIMNEPWKWGHTDCCSTACRVFEAWHGVNPMKVVSSFTNGVRAGRIITRWGGFLPMCERLADIAGLTKGQGAAYEIGIVPGRNSLAVCLSGGFWITKIETGYELLPKVRHSWSI